jgi:uncharacterized protein
VTIVKPDTTYLALTDRLPLSCTRSGTCCYGKMVWLNPWELARMAAAKGISSHEFRDRYCEFGGIRLRFDGAALWKGQAPCSQYVPDQGCAVHEGRPLVCRLFPLGRMRQGEALFYFHRKKTFPCLDECPEVADRPQLTVADYLKGQDAAIYEAAQDAYIDIMQRLADGAFALLFETGLAATGDLLTLPLWRKLGNKGPQQLTEYLGGDWTDRLMLPGIDKIEGPESFARQHHDLIETKAQEAFGSLPDIAMVREASGKMMGLALHLGLGLGIHPMDLAEKWVATAKELGARE